MVKINNKGFSLIEIIVCVLLLSVISIFIYRLLSDVTFQKDNEYFASKFQSTRMEIYDYLDSLSSYNFDNYQNGALSSRNNDTIHITYNKENDFSYLVFADDSGNTLRKFYLPQVDSVNINAWPEDVNDNQFIHLNIEVYTDNINNTEGNNNTIDDIDFSFININVQNEDNLDSTCLKYRCLSHSMTSSGVCSDNLSGSNKGRPSVCYGSMNSHNYCYMGIIPHHLKENCNSDNTKWDDVHKFCFYNIYTNGINNFTYNGENCSLENKYYYTLYNGSSDTYSCSSSNAVGLNDVDCNVSDFGKEYDIREDSIDSFKCKTATCKVVDNYDVNDVCISGFDYCISTDKIGSKYEIECASLKSIFDTRIDCASGGGYWRDNPNGSDGTGACFAGNTYINTTSSKPCVWDLGANYEYSSEENCDSWEYDGEDALPVCDSSIKDKTYTVRVR